MASDRNPSGLPGQRVVNPMWGPTDLDQRVGVQHDGLLRVRRSLFTSTLVIAALAAFVAIFGSMDTALGIAAIFIGPLVLILAVLQVIVEITRPKQRAPKQATGTPKPR